MPLRLLRSLRWSLAKQPRLIQIVRLLGPPWRRHSCSTSSVHDSLTPSSTLGAALELAPDDENVLRTLYAVLRRRRKRKEARDLLRRVPNSHRMDATQRGMLRWLDVFIEGVAQGHAPYVKQMIAQAGMTETMEPLWHAVRAELGEEIGPAPGRGHGRCTRGEREDRRESRLNIRPRRGPPQRRRTSIHGYAHGQRDDSSTPEIALSTQAMWSEAGTGQAHPLQGLLRECHDAVGACLDVGEE